MNSQPPPPAPDPSYRPAPTIPPPATTRAPAWEKVTWQRDRDNRPRGSSWTRLGIVSLFAIGGALLAGGFCFWMLFAPRRPHNVAGVRREPVYARHARENPAFAHRAIAASALGGALLGAVTALKWWREAREE